MKNLTDFLKTAEPVWIRACSWFWSKVQHGIAILSLEDFLGDFVLIQKFSGDVFL